jgi:hypothetical protein
LGLGKDRKFSCFGGKKRSPLFYSRSSPIITAESVELADCTDRTKQVQRQTFTLPGAKQVQMILKAADAKV